MKDFLSRNNNYVGKPGKYPKIISACLDLKNLEYDDYATKVKKRSESVIRDIRKAKKNGYYCKRFMKENFIPDFVEINHSKDMRSGGEMRGQYRLTVEEVGGAPKEWKELCEPDCPVHGNIFWGVFKEIGEYRQGDVVTNEKLVAYIKFNRLGNWAVYGMILGHGEHLRYGIMHLLHFHIMEWITIHRESDCIGLEYLMYAGWKSGGEGLQNWKKRLFFEPVYMIYEGA